MKSNTFFLPLLTLFTGIILAPVEKQLPGAFVQKIRQTGKASTEPNAMPDLSDTAKLKASPWFAKVQREIAAAEYGIRWQKNKAAYQSPNRKHNLRITYTADAMNIAPREANNPWAFGLTVKAIAADNQPRFYPAATPGVAAENNAIRFTHNRDFTVEYVNSEAGVRQNFIVQHEPAVHTRTLSVQLAPTKGWKTEQQTPTSLSFKKGAQLLAYNDLKVWDATGRILPAQFSLTEGAVHIDVAAAGAMYPVTIDPIVTNGNPGNANTVLANSQYFSLFGYSVRGAGDVNGDGYGDVLIGAPYYDNGQTNEGAVFVYPGSAAGIVAGAATMLESNMSNALLGQSVSGAGDVNGDGYSDIVAGSMGYSNGQTNEGAVYIYHGSASGINTTPALIMESNQANAQLGNSVACAGDVNGDGYSDIIAGAAYFTNGQASEGAAFVFRGSVSGIVPASVVLLEGNVASASYGTSVSGAGDVNGDGYSDVVVGSPNFVNGQTSEGAVYVYHGSASGISNTATIRLESDQANAQMGWNVSGAGDVNGDGFSDIVVGVVAYDDGQSNEGGVFIYNGGRNGIGSRPSAVLETNQDNALFGLAVGAAGDVNGDGYADIIAYAYRYNNGVTNLGAAFVYHGSANGIVTTAAAKIEGMENYSPPGWPNVVAGAGDVNGDGYSDIVVGAEFITSGTWGSGQAYVFHGSASGVGIKPVATLESNQDDAGMGATIAGAGDVNGDGYNDVIVGASYYDNGETNEGSAFVYHGGPSGLNTTPDATMESDRPYGYMAVAVAGAGDVNGDGYSDVLVGSPYYTNNYQSEGAVHVYYGSPSGINTSSPTVLEGGQFQHYLGARIAGAGDVNGDGYSDIVLARSAQGLGFYEAAAAYIYHGGTGGIQNTPATVLQGPPTYDYWNWNCAGLGDVNGDGYSDIIIGETVIPLGSSVNSGSAYIYFGSASGIGNTPDVTLQSNQPNTYLGFTTAGAGDVNGDGFNDVLVGGLNYAPGQPQIGRVFIYHGKNGGLNTTPAIVLSSGHADAGYYGLSAIASAGDVNGDGYSDIIVGSPHYNSGEGLVHIYHGSPSGIGTVSQTLYGGQSSSYFGSGVSGAGDINGDGYSDVIVGAPMYDNGSNNEGLVFVYQGNNGGGLRHNNMLYDQGSSQPITAGNVTDTRFDARLYTKNFRGRSKARMVWEVVDRDKAFSGTVITNDVSYSGMTSLADLGARGTDLYARIDKSASRLTKVRYRVKYDPVTSLNGQVYGPWRYPQDYLSGGCRMSATPLYLYGFKPAPVTGSTTALAQRKTVMMIAPNPATDVATVRFKGLDMQQSTVLQITDASGRSVQVMNIGKQQEGAQSISMQQLPAGIYLVTLTNGSQRITQRVVKQ